MEYFIDVFGLKKREKLLRDELYVMLMLMRSENENPSICEETDVKVICAVEEAAEEYKDCPAACRKDNSKEEDNNSDEVVKSGDLAVSATAAEGKKALIGGTSDLDTLTFKTSEEVTISSITLERYGYSTIADVATVQLEDEDGNIIADAKELNSKGQVKLNIKKDYRNVDGTFKATVVLTTIDGAKATTKFTNGSSIGFKVVAAESTAKNLNLDNYDPYLYDLVNYAGSAVQFSSRNSATKSYNWEAGKSYEVAKFRVKSPADASILVKGFTLTDNKNNVIDADKYAKDVTVTFDGKEVSGLKWSINKDEELVISFNEVEIEGKKTASIAVNMSFNEEFDNFGAVKGVTQYYIKNLTNFNATDKKTGARVSQDAGAKVESLPLNAANGWTVYTFNGGKVKLSGSKLGTINAAANSTNVLIAEGEITVTEALRGDVYVEVPTGAATFIDEIRFLVGKEDTVGKTVTNPTGLTAGTYYEFKGVEIEKSDKIEIRVDLKDTAAGTISFPASLNSNSFILKYDESGENVATTQIAGSISISNVKAQAAKASLENKLTKEVELIKAETNRSTIFEGTYTAKNGAVTLKNFVITPTATMTLTPAPTFYVTIDNEEYDADYDTTAGNAKGDIDDIEVADGKSVNVKVEIEFVPAAGADKSNTFNIKFEGEDEDNNKAGEADDDTVKVKTVDKGSLNVNSSAKNTVLLKSDRSLAEFTIKPSKSGDNEVTLDNLVFELRNGKPSAAALANQGTSEILKVVVGGDTITAEGSCDDGVSTTKAACDAASGVWTYSFEYKPETRISAEGVVVKVSLKSELPAAGERTLTLTHVNAKSSGAGNESRMFRKYYLPAVLKMTQEKKGDVTKYNIDVEKDDSSTTVSNVIFYYDTAAGTACSVAGEGTASLTPTGCTVAASTTDVLADTDNSLQGTNGDTAKSITVIAYKIGTNYVVINKADYEDYFKVNGGDYLMLFSNK